MADEEKELAEIVTLDCKNDVKDDNSIADAPPVPSHSEAYGIFN